MKTRRQLAREYGVSYDTLNKWLAKVPGLTLEKYQCLLSPKQLELIYNHLGEPENLPKKKDS